MVPEKKLFLLDAMALIYRAYYALNKNPRFNSKGLNTSATLGFVNTLYDVIKNEKPTHIGVAFDTQSPTIRHDDFTAYKANRQAMPEELSASLPYIMQLIEAFNIPLIFAEGYEADDVIGTMAKQAEEQGFTTFMMTPDKDFGQLVSDKTFIYKPAKFGAKAVVMGVNEVCEKFGVKRPDQVIDMLGLWGDASDNIPGIPGVGEVTARKLLQQFDSLENLLQNYEQIANPALKEKVKTFADQAIMSKQLATIILDVPVEFNSEALKLIPPNTAALKKILDELEFRTFAKRVFTDLSLGDNESKPEQNSFSENLFPEEVNPEEETVQKLDISSVPHQYHLVDTFEKRQSLISELNQQKIFCFDTETTGVDTSNSELVAMSFCYKSHEAYLIPVPADYNEAHKIVAEFKSVFENPNIEKIGQNIKFDISILKWYDIEVKGKLFDTMLAHYLIQPDMRHNMDFLAQSYLNYIPVPIESLIGKKNKDQLSMRVVETDVLKEYACEDADVTFQLKQIFDPILEKDQILKLFETVEMPLVPVLSAMETAGIKIDVHALNEYAIQLQNEIAAIEKEIHTMAGIDFNIASPKQTGEVLFDRLNIVDKAKLTKTKQYATGEEVLVKLKNKHPIVEKILDYRGLAKLKSTYVDTLPLMVNERTGRVHASFNQAVAATGRLSSNNPNMQNIPVRTERGREIRKAFVPANHNFLLLSADYSQIELRIIAHMSKDEDMIAAFKQGVDIHTATAAKVYNVELAEVTKEMRRNAKTVNFGIIYGISAFGLSERLNIPRKEAAQIIEQYFLKYPTIKQYMDQSIAFAREHGYVETIMGRRRYIKDINSYNSNSRGYAERNAINAPIQGSAADMIKIAMIKIYQSLCEKNLKSRMILQVHDELVFDAHKDELEILKPIILHDMQHAIEMSVPIEVEMSTGENWLEAH